MYEFDYKYKNIDGIQVHTVGCLTSENDAISFSKTLEDKDSIVISTCYFLEQREKENIIIIDLIRKLYPNNKYYIIGCGANYLKDRYKDCICINNRELNNIVNVAESKYTDNILNIKIQEGCKNNCSFCLVHKLRGELNSTPYDDIKDIIDRELNNREYINLNLCGIELTNYIDHKYNLTFSGLIKQLILDFDKINSINIGMSLDPSSKEIFDLIKISNETGKINSPIYLAVQSCNDFILKDMRRNHRVNDINHICKFAKDNNVNLGWELIVGYPGETEEYFNDTLNSVKTWKPSELSIFPYSPREGTDAFYMENQIDNYIKCKRAELLYNESEQYNMHKHNNSSFSIERYKLDIKNLISENNFKKFKFNINNIEEIYPKIINSSKPCILEFNYETELDKIYINFFKEFMPNVFIIVKSNIIENKDLFENQFHCMVI